MNVKSLKIPEILLITPEIHNDERGSFFEFFNQEKFNKCTGLNEKFVQDNISVSKKGVLRGLHFQEKPMEQGKLVGVLSGEIFDVAVDIRKSLPFTAIGFLLSFHLPIIIYYGYRQDLRMVFIL